MFKSPEGKKLYLQAYDAVLKNVQCSYEEFAIETLYAKTHVIACGAKDLPPLILLHAANVSSTIWFPNLAELSQQFRVYALDIPTQAGKSEYHKKMSLPQQCADWLAEVLEALKIQQVNLVGLSYGGWIALNFALHKPEQVRKLILLSPASPLAPFKKSFFLRLLPAAFIPTRSMITLSLKGMFGKKFTIPTQFMNQMVLGMKHFKPDVVASPFPKVLTDEQLHSLHIPTMLLLGEQETTFDPKVALQRAQKNMPGVKAEMISGVGHALSMENPALVNAKMIAFLKS